MNERKAGNGGLQNTRASQIHVREIDDENYRVRLSVASSEPVIRSTWFGDLKEVVKIESADIEWLKSGNAALLDQHDTHKQIGTLANPEVGVGGGYARLYVDFIFYPDVPESKAAWDKVKAGFSRNVSIGWSSREDDVELIKAKDADDDVNTIIFNKAVIQEVSIVTCPADKNVGVGRETSKEYADALHSMIERRDKTQLGATMPEENKGAGDDQERQDAPETSPADPPSRDEGDPAPKAETRPAYDDSGQRWLADNEATLRSQGMDDETITKLRAVVDKGKKENGTREADIMKAAWDELSRAEEGLSKTGTGNGAPAIIDNSRVFDIGRVCEALTKQREVDGLEREVLDEFSHRTDAWGPKRKGAGVMIPHSALLQDPTVREFVLTSLAVAGKTDARYAAKAESFKRATEVGSALVGFWHEAMDESYLIEALIAQANFLKKCTVINEQMVQDLSVVKESNDMETTWTDETGAIADQTGANRPSYANFVFQWHQINSRQNTTFRAITQSRYFMGRLLEVMRRDLPRGINKALLNRTTITNAVDSIFGGYALTTVNSNGAATQTNGGAPTYPGLTALRGAVEGANAMNQNRWVYVMDAETKQSLYNKGKFQMRDIPIIMQNGEMETIDGYEVVTDNNLPNDFTKGSATNCHAILFGDVGDVVIAPFSGVEITVDPWNGIANSEVHVYSRQALDVKLQRTGSLAEIIDAIPG